MELPKLVLEGPESARQVLTRRLVAMRDRTNGPVIGFFEPNTTLTVLTVSAGWAAVLPAPLEVAPLEGRNFWVWAADLKG